MNKSQKASAEIQTEYGFVGFFDILGYRRIAANNQIKKAAQVVEKVLKKVRESQAASDFVGKLIEQKFCRHVVFSDSIVIFSQQNDRTDKDTQRTMFTSICAGLVSSLFWEGLPVRGALALGEYYVKIQPESICLIGKPIIEAYELADQINLAGCVVTPSAESAFSANSSHFIEYPVPIKGQQKQRMLMLNNYTNGWAVRKFSRRVVLQKFSKYNKPVGIEVLPKINNTLDFYEVCRKHGAELAKRLKINSLPQ